MKNSHNHPPLSPELQDELSYFLRVRNRYTRIVLGLWRFVLLWLLLLGGLAMAAEIFGLLSRRFS
jgi:hypothetical protein